MTTRRGLRLAALLAAAAAALVPLARDGVARSAPLSPRVQIAGARQVVFDWRTQACVSMGYPDLPARAFRDAAGRVQLLLSHFIDFRMVGPDLEHLRVECAPVMRSDRSASVRRFDDREWIASVYTRDGTRVWALVHEEYQGNRHRGRCPAGRYLACWYNAITLAHSRDGGALYTHARPPAQLVAAAPSRYRADSGPTGVFAPSNIVSGPGGYLYALVRVREPHAVRGVCVMRTRHIADPRSWRAWNGVDFSGVFRDPYWTRRGRRFPCATVGVGAIAEMDESLTYSTALGRYLLVGLAPPGAESIGPKVRGIYFSTSVDLVHWTPRRLVTRAVTTHNYSCGGPSPLAYPSVIDPESGSRTFATSGAHPYLYYTQMRFRSCRQTPDRDLVRVALEVTP